MHWPTTIKTIGSIKNPRQFEHREEGAKLSKNVHFSQMLRELELWPDFTVNSVNNQRFHKSVKNNFKLITRKTNAKIDIGVEGPSSGSDES